MIDHIKKILLTAMTVAAGLSLLNYGLAQDRVFEGMSAVLILISAYYLWRYTQATQDMKEAMVQQNEFALRPVLNLYLDESGSTAGRFVIRNVSHVPAYNIDVEPIHVDDRVYVFHFVGENFILEGGQERALHIFSNTEAGNVSIVTDAFRSHVMTSSYAVFLIRYKSLMGKTFHSVFKYYSRHDATHEVMIEFVTNGEGPIPMADAHAKAGRREKRQSLYSSMWRKKKGQNSNTS